MVRPEWEGVGILVLKGLRTGSVEGGVVLLESEWAGGRALAGEIELLKWHAKE